MMIPKEFLHKKILILGLGKEGMSTLEYFHTHHPSISLSVADKKPYVSQPKEVQEALKNSGAVYFGGDDYLKHLPSFDVVLRSPGISPYLPEIKLFRESGNILTSQTQLFLHRFHSQCIGVTGTKGKSTTASLIYHILQQARFDVQLIGNIGLPPFTVANTATDKTIFVYELSSHQLQDCTVSPHIAVVLDIVPEHLDYYPSFTDYREAKTPIVRYQRSDDVVVFNQELPEPKGFAALSAGKKYPFSYHPQKDSYCYIEDNYIFYKGEKIITLEEVPLKGLFNSNNVMASVVVGKHLGIATSQLHDAIKTFKPLSSRLENIGTYKGITFYDDSLATIPEATIGALDALGTDVQTIIVGGFERNQNFDALAQKILQTGIENVIAFPTTGQRIWQSIELHNTNEKKLKYFPVASMREAVHAAFDHTREGKICLLSSASPSFSLFKNYQEKSKAFHHFVQNIGSS